MPSSSGTLSILSQSSDPHDLLFRLKDLKNAIIGNTWKKVEVADDAETMSFLISKLHLTVDNKDTTLEIVQEVAIIIGSLANVGSLTIRPLLVSQCTHHLLYLIRSLTLKTLKPVQLNRVLPSIIKALRNILISTADLVWGHMWGVGAEQKVVATGLLGSETQNQGSSYKGKGKAKTWTGEAVRALSMVFEDENLTTLLGLLETDKSAAVLLPLYQLFSRLIALPRHSQALAEWVPEHMRPDPAIASDLRPTVHSAQPISTSYILDHLLYTISTEWSLKRQNSKILEAGMDLLASLVKGQPHLARLVLTWSYASQPRADIAPDNAASSMPEIMLILLDLLNSGPASVRIAAAGCFTNTIKAGARPQVLPTSCARALEVVTRLLQSEAMEDQGKLCFILAELMRDDPEMQKSAAERDCPKLVIQLLTAVEAAEQSGDISNDLASKVKEASLLALASLAFQNDSTRSYIADSDSQVLTRLLAALAHQSYGVRAAACQLARALSRTVAIVRTTLVDSGVGEGIIEALKREIETDKARRQDGGDHQLGERAYTVEVAATATLCNLIANYSPFKQRVLDGPVFELVCDLVTSPYMPVAHNALWTIKNATFKSSENTKKRVMAVLGWGKLISLLGSSTPLPLRTQAFEITQNIFADMSSVEIARTFEKAGEDAILDAVQAAFMDSARWADLRRATLYVVSNLAIGNDRIRQAIVARLQILQALSESLDDKSPFIQIASLKALRHLIEANSKTHKPRLAMIDVFAPYALRTRIKTIGEESTSLDVTQGAMILGEVLDRGRGMSGIARAGSIGGTDVRE